MPGAEAASGLLIGERRQDLRDRFPQWEPNSLAGWLDACADRYPDRPFVIADGAVVTYSAVAEESRRLAAGLIALGVRPGDRVGVLMANYPEFVGVKFAIARAGATAVPLNFFYRQDELAFVLADSGCRVLVTMTVFAALDYQQMLDGLAPGWDDSDFAGRAREADGVPALRHVVLLDTGGVPRAGTLSMAGLSQLGVTAPSPVNWPVVDPSGAGDILYTSGTTGSPKGVLLSHDAVLRTAYASALTRAYQDGRRILFSLPCYHMFGYVEGLLSAMYVGGAVVLLPRFSPEAYFRAIARHRVSDILCVPTMAVAMSESAIRGDYDLSSLTAVLCGSAPAPVWLWQKFAMDFGVAEIVTGYGMTESGGCVTLTLPEDPLEVLTETVGMPKLAGVAGLAEADALVTYRSVDPDSGSALPPNESGELISAGPTTMLGYWNRPDETAQALRDGWLHSGDLGRIRPNGYLQLTGRSKELYKSGGELVMPKEVEDVLCGHPDISQAFAIGLADERWGEIGCAVIVPVQGKVITEPDVIEFCRLRLARFKVPKRVAIYRAEDLPTTATGKVQKYRLVEQLEQMAAWRHG